MIPFALLHIGKPEAETISCLVSGIYFGYALPHRLLLAGLAAALLHQFQHQVSVGH